MLQQTLLHTTLLFTAQSSLHLLKRQQPRTGVPVNRQTLPVNAVSESSACGFRVSGWVDTERSLGECRPPPPLLYL
jgi:hypothetical protein